MNDRLEIASRLEAAQVQFQGKLSDCDPQQCMNKADRLIAIERESRGDALRMQPDAEYISPTAGKIIAEMNARIAELEALRSSDARIFEALKLQEIGEVIGFTAGDYIPPAILPWIKDANGRIDSIEAREIACDRMDAMLKKFESAGLTFALKDGRPTLTFADGRGDTVAICSKVVDAAKAVVEADDAVRKSPSYGTSRGLADAIDALRSQLKDGVKK